MKKRISVRGTNNTNIRNKKLTFKNLDLKNQKNLDHANQKSITHLLTM